MQEPLELELETGAELDKLLDVAGRQRWEELGAGSWGLDVPEWTEGWTRAGFWSLSAVTIKVGMRSGGS